MLLGLSVEFNLRPTLNFFREGSEGLARKPRSWLFRTPLRLGELLPLLLLLFC